MSQDENTDVVRGAAGMPETPAPIEKTPVCG